MSRMACGEFFLQSFRENTDLEKAYMQGRFDAVTYFDESVRKYWLGKEIAWLQESFVFGLSVDWGDGEGVASCTSQPKPKKIQGFISPNRLHQPCHTNAGLCDGGHLWP